MNERSVHQQHLFFVSTMMSVDMEMKVLLSLFLFVRLSWLWCCQVAHEILGLLNHVFTVDSGLDWRSSSEQCLVWMTGLKNRDWHCQEERKWDLILKLRQRRRERPGTKRHVMQAEERSDHSSDVLNRYLSCNASVFLRACKPDGPKYNALFFSTCQLYGLLFEHHSSCKWKSKWMWRCEHIHSILWWKKTEQWLLQAREP